MLKHLMLCAIILLAANTGAGSLDVKVYKGTSSYNSDILATIRDGRVYSGRSNYNSDILFTVDGNLTIEEFVAVWHCVMYMY